MVASERKYFLCEKEGDEDMCAKNGWQPFRGTADGMIKAAQEWGTEEYRTYVHSHHEPAQAALQQW